MFFERMADFIMKRSKLIIAIWIVAIIVAIPFAIQSNSVMQYDMSKMSSGDLESKKGAELLSSSEFNQGTSLGGGTILLVQVYDSQTSYVARELDDRLQTNFFFWEKNEQFREDYGPEYQITIKKIGSFDDKYFKDKETELILFSVSYPVLPDNKPLKASSFVPEIRDLVKQSSEGIDGIISTYVTGSDAISYDTMTGSVNDIKHIDPISILLVLILIGLFFKSIVSAGTPPVVIGMAYGILLSLVFGIGQLMGIFYITTILVLVVMLGAGCDYCIFIISRYREERKSGKDKGSALRESIIWAGESILISGISVMIGFGSLMLCSFSLVSTMGVVLALGVLLALLAALTFVPSMLNVIGDKIFWPASMETYTEGSKSMNGWYGKLGAFGQRYFTKSAKQSIKHAKVFAVITILLTVPLGYVALTSESSYDMISTMPDGEAKSGVGIISEDLGGGMIMPTNISMKVDAFVDIDVNGLLQSGQAAVGDNVTFTATPYAGFMVDKWQQNGADIPGSEGQDSISVPITADTNIVVFYKPIVYDIVVAPTAHGSATLTVDGTGAPLTTTAKAGARLVINAAPDAGYRVDYWKIIRNGNTSYEYTHDTELEIGQASYNYQFIPVFGVTPTVASQVTFSHTGNGTVTARADDVVFDSGSNVLNGSHLLFNAIADTGWKLDRWTVVFSDNTTVDRFVSNLEFSTSGEFPDPDKTVKSVTAKFVEKTLPTYTVKFSCTGEGSITAYANGVEIPSGTAVDQGTRVVIKAAPADGKVIQKWQYSSEIPIFGPYTFDSYVSKTDYTVISLNSNLDVNVVFSDPSFIQKTVTYGVTGGNGSVVGYVNGNASGTGAMFYVGSNLFFEATPYDGYRVDHWIVDGSNVYAGTSLSLSNKGENVNVSVVFTPANPFIVTYSSADESKGIVTAYCDETYFPYQEFGSASPTYAALNGFSKQLLDLETSGKNNVAIAIGPMSGDIVFDGEHEWLFNTVVDLLPQAFKNFLSGVQTYDAAVYVWNNLIPYDLQQEVNYLLTYKLGFLSDVFEEDGHKFQYVKIMVVTKDEPMSSLSVDTVKQVYSQRDDFMAVYGAANGGFAYCAYLSGAAVSNYEISELVSHDFGFIIVVVIVLLILLLFVVMRSYITPLRAVFTIVMSVLWTLGLTHILFEKILGMPVVWIVPIVLFVVCLGLGMDYDILLTTRIKENVMKGMSNDDAITAAIQSSGVVITLCGLIMASAFGTMMVSTSPMLMEFGFALGFAIAVDALFIRTYVVPAIMHLLGDWNWKGPNLTREKMIERFMKIYDPTLGIVVGKIKSRIIKE